MWLSRPATRPTATGSCRCWSATSARTARRRSRRRRMAVLPAARTWIARRHAGCATWPFTRRAASASKTWSAAAGSIASCATSGPASRPVSPASSGRTAWPAAPGAGSTTSRPMSGPRWWPTTSLFSFACDQAEASAALSRSGKLAIASLSSCPRLRQQALFGADCTFDQAKFPKYIHNSDKNIAPNSQTEGKTARLWTETRLELGDAADLLGVLVRLSLDGPSRFIGDAHRQLGNALVGVDHLLQG